MFKISECSIRIKSERLNRIVEYWIFGISICVISICFLKGIRALHSPHTGIVDYGLLCRHYGKSFEQLGGQIALNFEADKFLPSNDPSYPILVKSKTNVTILLSFLFLRLCFDYLGCLFESLCDYLWWITSWSTGCCLRWFKESDDCPVSWRLS